VEAIIKSRQTIFQATAAPNQLDYLVQYITSSEKNSIKNYVCECFTPHK